MSEGDHHRHLLWNLISIFVSFIYFKKDLNSLKCSLSIPSCSPPEDRQYLYVVSVVDNVSDRVLKLQYILAKGLTKLDKI